LAEPARRLSWVSRIMTAGDVAEIHSADVMMANLLKIAKRKQAAPTGKKPARPGQDPRKIEAAFHRAQLFWQRGQTEEAKRAFLEVLALSPTHFGALNNLGALLHASGFKSAARTCYAEAVKQHPDNPMGHVNLANSLLEIGELAKAREHYEKALRIDPGHGEAHQGFANLLEEQGEEESAGLHRELGYKDRSMVILPYRGQGRPIPVIMLVSATRGNVPIQRFLDDHVFLVTVIVTEFYDPAQPLPPHCLIVNSIGNADICQPALEAAEKLVSLSPAPVINAPAAVLATGRVAVAERLRVVPHVVTPCMADWPRTGLEAPDVFAVLARQGFAVPFLLRAPGFNNGRYFFKIDGPQDLAAALEAMPGQEFTVIQFLDARRGDGKTRKYRVMMVNGQIYPLHAAIARHWKIHYNTSETPDDPELRAEEEAFLHDMPKALGQKAMTALENIRDILDLDYGGVDFSIDAHGHVVLFEANATMIVYAPEPGERFDYRRAPIKRIMNAVQDMLMAKSCSETQS